MIDLAINYLENSGAITLVVLALLSFYFILILWVFFYRFFSLNSIINNEKISLENLSFRNGLSIEYSILYNYIRGKSLSKEILEYALLNVTKDTTKGISTLSIVASTSPFIGLFGTVVGILESFATFATKSKVGFSTIAPAISEALVATAGGILVAIFAYTFHQILIRKSYELNSYLKSEINILLSRI